MNQAVNPWVDVLLVTVTQVEGRTVLDLFAQATGSTPRRFFIDQKAYFDLGSIAGTHVVMVQSEMGEGGPGGSLLVVNEGIRSLAPGAVIMVGIAFGLDTKKLTIGDILVSRQLLGYELQKVATDKYGQAKIFQRGDCPQASIKLLDRFRSGSLDWQGARVEFGLILSGSKLLDNRRVRDELLSLAPEAIGGEMEGNGLYAAAQLHKVDWILVKAICDLADGHKANNEAGNQKLAAENAVKFTLHVLRQGGFAGNIPRTPSEQKPTNLPRKRGTLLFCYDVHASWVVTVAWQPGGTHIASAGGDGMVRIWEAETGEKLLTYRGHKHALNIMNIQATIYTVAWAPEGLRIASAGHGSATHVWDATTGDLFALRKDQPGILAGVFAVAWSPDGKQIASACSSIGLNKTILLWDSNTGQTITRYTVHSSWLPNFYILSLVWSPDGSRIAAACDDKTIRLWNTITGQSIATYRSHEANAVCLAWSPNSRYLASAYPDRTASIWDTYEGKEAAIYRNHTDSVRCVAWSPDGRLIASASNDQTVHIWEAATRKRLYVYTRHQNWVTSVSWSPDGTRIASGSNDKTVHIWYAGPES
jgi:WD40 repeat protein/nucleoside phosphorylase